MQYETGVGLSMQNEVGLELIMKSMTLEIILDLFNLFLPKLINN